MSPYREPVHGLETCIYSIDCPHCTIDFLDTRNSCQFMNSKVEKCPTFLTIFSSTLTCGQMIIFFGHFLEEILLDFNKIVV